VPVAPGTPSHTPLPQRRRARGPQPPGGRQVPARIRAAVCQQRRGRAPAGAAVAGHLHVQAGERAWSNMTATPTAPLPTSRGQHQSTCHMSGDATLKCAQPARGGSTTLSAGRCQAGRAAEWEASHTCTTGHGMCPTRSWAPSLPAWARGCHTCRVQSGVTRPPSLPNGAGAQYLSAARRNEARPPAWAHRWGAGGEGTHSPGQR
jgi:hypothetical protein